jgi:RNA polymerase sigma-70 factor (ECF subfamily)
VGPADAFVRLEPAPEVSGGLDLAAVHRTLTRAVRAVCPRRLEAERDDLVQGAMVRVLAATRGRNVNATYVWKAASCALLDEVRRARRRHEVPLVSEPTSELRDGAPGPERALSARDLEIAVRSCLGTLSPDRRRAVALHVLGYTPREAARVLETGVKRVSNCVFRGLADLRACLRQKGIEP